MLSADIEVPWVKMREAAPELDELLKNVSKPKQAAKASRAVLAGDALAINATVSADSRFSGSIVRAL